MNNTVERDFKLALALRCNEWGLGDNGHSDTVLVCEVCDHDKPFMDREGATAFLNSGEKCPECEGGE